MKKLETKSTVLLSHHLKALKLPTMTAECQKVALRCAQEVLSWTEQTPDGAGEAFRPRPTEARPENERRRR